MIIDLSDILKQYGNSKKFEGYIKLDSVDFNNQYINFVKPAHIDGTITNLGEVFDIDANVSVLIQCKCDRCLKDMNYNLSVDIIEKFSKEPIDVVDVNVFKGQSIVLDDVIRDNILINLPIQIICNEDCKGLCPKCGNDNNINSCSCDDGIIDPRLAKLKNLFK